MLKTSLHILVSGKVQGVGFRNFTVESAKVDKISGWVRNLNDGRVEVLAQGDAAGLAQFVERLHKGPRPLAMVSEVSTEVVELGHDLGPFVVKKDGEKAWSKFC